VNANIPTIGVFVKNEYLFNLEKGGGFTEGYAFGIRSARGRAIGFHVMLKTGAHWRNLPINALWWYKPSKKTKSYTLEELELWDCFTEKVQVIQWDYLQGHECNCWLRNKEVVPGEYFCSVEWLKDGNPDTSFINIPDQDKCAHIIKLDNGQLAALPTNRVEFKDAYFIGNKPTASKEGYIVNTHVWSAETCNRWSVSEECGVFYLDEEEKKCNTKQK
jgi:hypothetical protein